MSAIIAPSLLSADFAWAGKVCEDLEKAGIKWLHLDVMDGNFVPNITIGPCVIKSLRKSSSLFFDVHLMIENPEKYINEFADAGSDLLAIHLESAKHPQLALQKIRDRGIYSGVALNPGTDFTLLKWLLPFTDLVLIMGVNPGFSGQRFIPETMAKLKACRAYLDAEGFAGLPIEVDGGASPDNAADLAESGASVLVSGSAFFKQADFGKSTENFENALKKQRHNTSSAAFANVEKWKHKGK